MEGSKACEDEGAAPAPATLRGAPPRLRRAVAESLRPGPAAVPIGARHVFEGYLADASTRDAAYLELLAQSSSGLPSPGCLARCLDLLKLHLTAHTPSKATLEEIHSFALDASLRLGDGAAQETAAARDDLGPALAYVQSAVAAHLGRDPLAGNMEALTLRAHRTSDGASSMPSPVPSFARTDTAELARGALGGDALSEAAMHKRSLSEGTASVFGTWSPRGAQWRQAAAGLAAVRGPGTVWRNRSGSMLRPVGPHQPKVSRSSHSSWGGSEGGLSSVLGLTRVSEASHSTMCPLDLPHLAEKPPPVSELRDLMQAKCGRGAAADPDAVAELRWGLARAPESAASLAPLLINAASGGFQPSLEADEYDEQEQFIAVTNLSQTQEHILTVAMVQHAQAEQPSARDAARSFQVPSMLFQYRPYSEQAPLSLKQRDVATVVEAVKGERPGSSMSPDGAALAAPGQLVWGRSIGRGSMANVCGSLLMKVVVDLWLRAGPAKSFPVVLEMLLDMVYNDLHELQERAFDTVYNLSVHAQLLFPTNPEAAAGAGGRAADRATLCWQAGRVREMEAWLRRILFALLSVLEASRAEGEAVWAAAFGAFVHLCAKSGAWGEELLGGLSPRVARGFLGVAERFSWSPELYCHLVRLAVLLLYPSPSNGEAPEAFADCAWKSRSLSLERLAEFGGERAAARVLLAAPSPEAQRNMFCVLLDAAASRAAEAASGQGSGEEDAAGAAALADASGLVQLIRPLALSRQPGMPRRLLGLVEAFRAGAGSRDAAEGGSRLPEPSPQQLSLLEAALTQVEAAEAERGSDLLDGPLEAFVAATLASVRGRKVASNLDSGSAWACLRDLLWSPSGPAAEAGAEWLFRLLAAAADQRLGGAWDAIEEGAALIPAPPGSSGPKSKGLADQPALRSLLGEVLGPGCPGPRPPCLVVAATEQLLHHIKARRGTADTLEAAREGASLPLARGCSALLATLEAAVEWVIGAPPRVRQPAMRDACGLLLSLLCVPPHLPLQALGADPGGGPAGSGSAGPMSAVHAFLAGESHIPQRLIRLVPVGMLVRMFDNLLASDGEDAGPLPKLLHRGLSCSDVRHGQVDWAFRAPSGGWTASLRSALLLLVIGRCSVQPTTLKMLGGEGWFHRLLNDHDANVRYYAAVFLLKRLMTSQPARYHKALHRLLLHAQQTDDHELLKNPYLQISAMFDMKLVDGY